MTYTKHLLDEHSTVITIKGMGKIEDCVDELKKRLNII